MKDFIESIKSSTEKGHWIRLTSHIKLINRNQFRESFYQFYVGQEFIKLDSIIWSQYGLILAKNFNFHLIFAKNFFTKFGVY